VRPPEVAKVARSSLTNPAATRNQPNILYSWQKTVMSSFLNGAGLSLDAVAIGRSNYRVKVLRVSAFAIGVAATSLTVGKPPTPIS